MQQHTDHQRTEDAVPYGTHGDQYIDGGWHPSLDTGSITVLNPATERVLATVAAGGAADVEPAVAAARRAARAWGATTREERLVPLTRLRDGLAAHQEEISARWPRSAVTRAPAPAASWAGTAWRSSCSASPCSTEPAGAAGRRAPASGGAGRQTRSTPG